MQELERASAMFCMACICAELVSRFVGQGWGQKCIKAAAGLYILVVLAEALSGIKAPALLSGLPQPGSVSVGTMENAVLAQAESELEVTLEEQCLNEAGIAVMLKITLIQTDMGVKAEAVHVRFPGSLSTDERQRIAAILTEQLEVSPDCLLWETPGGEDAP